MFITQVEEEEGGKVRCEDEDKYCVDYRVTTVYSNKAKLRYKEEYRFKGCSNATVSSLLTIIYSRLIYLSGINK